MAEKEVVQHQPMESAFCRLPFAQEIKGARERAGRFVYINYSRRAERNKVIDFINFGVQMLSELRRSRAGEGEIAVACANYPARVFLLSFAEVEQHVVRTYVQYQIGKYFFSKRQALVEPVCADCNRCQQGATLTSHLQR